mmetsp:Transcript_12646/g.22383  ORF Transcript_12646/g.22383 Transcript_12646/m.22383 type:complete len:295 (-) Transcript_12646:301-1185(-)|eukprot:CAMPEP_0119101572 /NCGR_PEP_ID=MMETSP1180-20130426/601_1 /TAXON_ID=3052 ORGANISM="Chlamydomonas cf sp, Strain CCMP681" /NCGR_SAMPLE_ID=MMETSP1180 /ASSEMBLY_ACC=CAM_ASM_000741 /LENGTH=294 /DNA_ID=CAMNT_0007085717 /DNA_START=29 /DNA_END=913 /DNA_ORIENTATION=+
MQNAMRSLVGAAPSLRHAVCNPGWALNRSSRTQMRSMAAASSSDAPVYMVFGASGGIGSALCQRLAKHAGASLILVGRDQVKLDALHSSLTTQPEGGVSVQVADVTDAKQVEAAVSKAVEAHGRLSGVANCVGSIVLKAAHQTSEAEFDQVMKLNLYSCFHILKPVAKSMMTTGGGSIVFCSSAVARHGIPQHEAIAAAKAGIVGLALSAAATYAPKNIRVNCVAPGLTRTPLAARITGNPASLKASEGMHALKRVGEADEVAAALEFMLTPSNSFVTGQCLAVDGGLSSLRPQ